MPAPEHSPVHDPSLTNLGPSAEVYGLAVESDQLEPVPDVNRHRRLGIGAWLAIIWLVGLLLLAVFAPLLPIPDPGQSFPEIARQGPVAGHILGGDANGRDMLSRIIYGTRASYAIGFGAVAFGLLIGGFLGLATGFFRGKVDGIITPLMTILLAIPQFVLALSLVTVLSSGDKVSSIQRISVVVVGLGIVSIPILGRITRATTLSWSEREFVLAARAQGARHARVMWREILPNVLPAMFSIALLGIAVVIVAEGGLAILGVGVKPPTPSWGNVINDGRSDLADAPWITLAPSAAIFFTVLALNYLGDVVRARFDVRESAL